MTIDSSVKMEDKNPILELIYTKAEIFVLKSSYFDLKTIEALVSFLQTELTEVRDDLRSKYIVRLIRRLHKSDIMLKKLENNTQAYNSKLNQFIDYGLQYYVDLVKIKPPSLSTQICRAFCIFSRPFGALNEITKNLKKSSLDESDSINTLASPMEEVPDSNHELDQQQSISPSLPDNCHVVDPNKVSVVFETDATPEKL